MEAPAGMRGIVLAVGAALVAGAAVAQPIDIGPAPGRLVDIGGRRLHINCTGTGMPAVVIEAGASAFAIDWTLVQPDVARARRVCTYDRAGSGWSDARPDVETPARVVADLHALLEGAGERGPYVLVGHSAGGLYVRLYQLDYPGDVLGLVLVDPSTEDRLFTLFQGRAVAISSLTEEQLATTLPASGNVPVPTRSPQTGAPFDRLPSDLYQRRVELDRRLIASFPPTVPAAVVRESAEGQRAALARLLESRGRPNNPMRSVPVVVLTRGLEQTPGIVANHAGLAAVSGDSRHTVVPDTLHEIHLSAPMAVIQAIEDVCVAVQTKARLRARP
jgi:pimeloyl-ACP methyl ester carboxylesterase